MASTVRIAIVGDARSAVTALKKTGAEAATTQTKLSKVSGAATKMRGPALAAVAGLGAGLFTAAQSASEFSDTVEATRVIFGPAAAAVEAFAKTAGKNFGLSAQAALDAAGTFGTIGKSAGLSGKDLSSFSNQFTGLAGDLASFKGGTPEEAITAIGAAMRGESEPIRRYGVLLDDATLRAEALKMGLIKSTKQALTPQNKALAAAAVITKQTADAQGDYARTAGSAKNQQSRLKAELANASVTMGTQLLPLLTRASTALANMATWAGKNVGTIKVFAAVIGGLAAAVLAISVAQKLWTAAQAIGTAATYVATAAQWLWNVAMMANPIGLIVLAVVALVAIIVVIATKTTWFQTIWKYAWTYIKQVAVAVFGFLKGYFVFMFNLYKRIFLIGVNYIKSLWAFVSSLPGRAWSVVVGVFNVIRQLPGKILEAIGNIAQRMWQVGTDIINGLVNGIRNGFNKVKNALGELTGKLTSWKGPRSRDQKLLVGPGQLIMGGLIAGIRSQVPALRAELGTVTRTITAGVGGSATVDLGAGRLGAGQAGAGAAVVAPITINVSVAATADPAEIGRQIVKAVEAYERRTGRRRLAVAA